MASPQAHDETTGREIRAGDLHALRPARSAAPCGIREKKPCVQGMPADPAGSTMGGGERGDCDTGRHRQRFHRGQGGYASRGPGDQGDRQGAFENTGLPALREGIPAESFSCAAPASVCRQVDRGAGGTLVTDFTDRYFSKGLYD